ncbi:hypothetical protein Tco_0404188 [Tanacetum coccineum]
MDDMQCSYPDEHPKLSRATARNETMDEILRKRISDKRTKNQAKNDKTEHGMEKRREAKVKSKPKSKKAKVNKNKSQVGNPLHYYWPKKSMITMKDLGLKGKSKAEIGLGYPLTQQAQQLEALLKETQPH